MNNWRTSAIGVALFAFGVAFFAYHEFQTAGQMMLTGVGLILAKDA